MLLVQNFLKNKSLKDLEQEHGVRAKICGHKMSLNYSVSESKESDLLSQQCRGIILRVADPKTQTISLDNIVGKTIVLARPFDRFFNYGQSNAAKVDFTNLSTTFYEKLDGTLCFAYFDDILQKWHVATRSIPEADVPIDDNSSYTFRSLFEEATLNVVGKDFSSWATSTLFRDTTYIFELTSPYNKIGIDYDTPRITLLGARKNLSGKEISPAFMQTQIKVPAAERYRFNSVEELMKFVSGLNPTKHEGVVVCDNNFNRVKVKNIGYLALSKIRVNSLEAPRSIIELILLGKIDDAIPFIPKDVAEQAAKYKEKYREISLNYKNILNNSLKEASSSGNKKGTPEHRKVFALAVQRYNGWLSPIMEQYLGNTKSLLDWIDSKKQVDGKWSNGFLDNVLRELKK